MDNTTQFVLKQKELFTKTGSVTWESPSNIALVKYWGKNPDQIPANPSISFTLNTCKTTTKLSYELLDVPSNKFEFELYFEGELKEDFKPKVVTFFQRIEAYVPFLKSYRFKIETSNSFPHSSGIASSASGMSALALCVMSLEQEINPDLTINLLIELSPLCGWATTHNSLQ